LRKGRAGPHKIVKNEFAAPIRECAGGRDAPPAAASYRRAR